MAVSNSIVRGAKFCATRVLPLWTLANPTLSNATFVLCMQGMGITSMSCYLRKFAVLILPCAFIGATYGAASGGALELLLGILIGLLAPGVLIWLAITVFHVAAYLAIFCAGWVVLFHLARWLFWSGF